MKLDFRFKNYKNKIHSLEKGFTLVEMIIYVGLLAMMMAVLSEILSSVLSAKLESEASSSVEQDGRFLLARLNYDLSRMLPTDTITSPAALGGTNSSLVFTVNGTTITYTLSGGNLTLNDGTPPVGNLNSSETTVAASPSSGFLFKKVGTSGKESIIFTFRLTSRTIKNSGAEIRDYEIAVGRR